MSKLRAVGIAAIAMIALPSPAHSSPSWISSALSELASSSCSTDRAAAQGTLSRIRGLRLPESGRAIIVNIPAGTVTAYEDGVAVIESRAVVGGSETRTPEMQTHVTGVRVNPTWTVPQGVLSRNGWRERLSSDPEWFERHGFDVLTSGGLRSPADAAALSEAVTTFVQRPGPDNALGRIRIGIENDQSIFLHDTNDPGAFENEVRASSAGCVRVEGVVDIAAWIVGTDVGNIRAEFSHGRTVELAPVEPVSVVLGYWTAWPDASGDVRIYPDIYELDPAADGEFCSAPASSTASEGIWKEYEAR